MPRPLHPSSYHVVQIRRRRLRCDLACPSHLLGPSCLVAVRRFDSRPVGPVAVAVQAVALVQAAAVPHQAVVLAPVVLAARRAAASLRRFVAARHALAGWDCDSDRSDLARWVVADSVAARWVVARVVRVPPQAEARPSDLPGRCECIASKRSCDLAPACRAATHVDCLSRRPGTRQHRPLLSCARWG